VRRQGMLYLYGSEASWRADYAMELRRRNGVEVEELGGPALAEREPDLGPGFARGREERSQLGEFRHAQRLYATDSRYASASSAAMQPVPALVTAWR